MKDAHLISADELRAAGALDVPPAWRDSLFVERDLFSGLVDDEAHPDDQYPSSGAEDEDEAVDDGPCRKAMPSRVSA